MQTKRIACRATVDGKVDFTAELCHVSPRFGGLQICFDRTVALEGSHKRIFSRPRFYLQPFTPSLLTRLSTEAMARGTALDLIGTDIGCWEVEHDPKESRIDTYPLKSASIRTVFFMDGISLKIDSHTDSGVSGYLGKEIAHDLPPITLSISIFVPTAELWQFLLPEESAVFSMEERLSKLPPSTT